MLGITAFAVLLSSGAFDVAATAGTPPGQSPPALVSQPTVSGTAQVGKTLTGTQGTWSSSSQIFYAYQWQRFDSNGANCKAISGATAMTYSPVAADVGFRLRFAVTASNKNGSTTASSAATSAVLAGAAAPTNTSLPTISGTATQGRTLTASPGSWSGTTPISYAYQWLRCDSSGANCAAISGATSQSYLLVSADVGRTMRVKVTASNSAGSASAQSAPTALVATSSSTGSSIYWGAAINGSDTYSYHYGGTWGNPPWDDTTWNRFESNTGKKAAILSWSNNAPWVHDFNYFLSLHEKVRARGDLSLISMSSGGVALRDIANGLFDSSLRTWAQQVAAWGHPLFLRWDWEMNGNWQPYSPGVNGNTASDFVNAWRHFHDLTAQAGASNVTWAPSSPHRVGAASPPSTPPPTTTCSSWRRPSRS
jgi:hypothetical protein